MRLRASICAALGAAVFLAPVSAREVTLDEATIADLDAAFAAHTLTSEALVNRCLARIRAYDRQGPALHAIIRMNPNAIAIARQLDAERRAHGPRSPLHGIPIVLKDNIDTSDMPTTGGSLLLEGSIPSNDAFVVRQLRAAGAIILAKVNLSEFASGINYSSLGGQTRNPNDPTRTAQGSSGGTGAAVAAGFAIGGLGTDTEGSVRAPSSANGIVGIRPTYGLVSHSGVMPLARTLDTVGPMARNVHDAAVLLDMLAAADPKDPSTHDRPTARSFTSYLEADALKGARIGVIREWNGSDPELNWIFEASIAAMRNEGATVIEIHLPKWILETTTDYAKTLRMAEFKPQMEAYLATLGPQYPKTFEQMIERSFALGSLRDDGSGPNPLRWAYFRQELAAGKLDDPGYRALLDHGLPMIRAVVAGVLDADKLDAFIYPTLGRAELVAGASEFAATAIAAGVSAVSQGGTYIAALSGSPDVTVPSGYTSDRLPIGISFVGRRFDDGRILGLAYSLEQATHIRRQPADTPSLPGDTIKLP